MFLRHIPFIIAVAVALVAACGGEPTGPHRVEGTYTAVRANGSALPTDVFTYSSGDSQRLLGGTLSLRAPDTLTLVLQSQYVSPNGSAGTPVSDTLRALYNVQGATLELSRLGARPLEFENPGDIRADGSIRITARRRLPPSAGVLGTYPVELLLRR